MTASHPTFAKIEIYLLQYPQGPYMGFALEKERKINFLKIDELKKGDCSMSVAGQLAMEGKHDQVEWLQQLGANVLGIVIGYARAGNHTKVEEYRDHGATIEDILIGYARAGDHTKVEEYYKKKHPTDDGLKAYQAYYYSAKKDESFKEKAETYKESVEAIVMGYMLARNHKKVEMYRKDGKISPNHIAFLYAFVGNHKKVIAYLNTHKVDVSFIADGYSGNKKRYDIRALLESYLDKRAGKIDSTNNKTKEYLSWTPFSFFQKSFTEKNAAVEALEKVLNGGKVNDLIKHLPTLRDGNLGRKLREFIKSGLAKKIVGDKEVNTVTQFIKALQEISNERKSENPQIP